MERIKRRALSLVAQMAPSSLSANEAKGVSVLPSRPRPTSRSNRPDTYPRLPRSLPSQLRSAAGPYIWVRKRSSMIDIGVQGDAAVWSGRHEDLPCSTKL